MGGVAGADRSISGARIESDRSSNDFLKSIVSRPEQPAPHHAPEACVRSLQRMAIKVPVLDGLGNVA